MLILRTSCLRITKSKTLDTIKSRCFTFTKNQLEQNKITDPVKTNFNNPNQRTSAPRLHPPQTTNKTITKSSNALDKISPNSNLHRLLQSLENQAAGTTQQLIECASFEDEIRLRRDQAVRTVFFKLNSKENNKELLNELIRVCQSIGCEVKNVFLAGKVFSNDRVFFMYFYFIKLRLVSSTYMQRI